MKKRSPKNLNIRPILIAFLLMWMIFPAKAQEENSLLWKIENPDTEKVTYIFGTMHTIPKDDFILPAEVIEHLSESELMLQEIDMSNINPDKLMSLMMFPEGKTLKDYLSTGRYEEFIETLEELGFDEPKIDYLTKMKPIGSYGHVITAIFEDQVSPEMELIRIAQENEIPIKGLETLEYQFALFDSIPVEEQMAIFYEDNLKRELKKLLKIYLKQDLEAMHEQVKESEMGEMEETFLTTRNENWIKKLIPLLHETSMFVAVGAAHLPGENGLLELLKKQGFKTTAVEFEFK